jgi:GTPase SAR1 family protein
MFICPENYPTSPTSNKTNPKSILAVGKPGIGKSLFCQKLVRDWAHDRLFERKEITKVPDFQFAFLLTT